MTNIANFPLVAPRKIEDGSYVWEQPTDVDPKCPYIDMDADYGLFVRYAIESADFNKGGGTIYTYGERVRASEVAATLERGEYHLSVTLRLPETHSFPVVRGLKVKITFLPNPEAFRGKVASLGFPADIVPLIVDGVYTSEYGYYFGLELAEEQQKLRGQLPRQPRSFEEFLEANLEFFSA